MEINLDEIFDNNFDCYADSYVKNKYGMDIYDCSVQAMTKHKFISIVGELIKTLK